jgi:hypothetical protein
MVSISVLLSAAGAGRGGKCEELAKLSKVPAIKLRLLQLAARYNRILREIEASQGSPSIGAAD